FLDKIESRVHDADVSFHRDGDDLLADGDVGYQRGPETSSELVEFIEDIGDIDQAVLVSIEDGEVGDHHDDVGGGPGLDGGGDLGGVVGAREGDVFDLDAIGLAPVDHLLAEQVITFLGERHDAPDGELAGELLGGM